ncbi:MarR family winged helix-turn-helix transcriptional regulator [Chryseobacterium sp. CT-SW4]|uniref:MarR family winged helix-turn-helix transcriptional regulator n=1 Tax=Chryseobacterium sp. SW-1 TaxID=3157343 RepID=UPI003B015BBE
MHSKELFKIFESDRDNSLLYQINFTENLLRTIMKRRFVNAKLNITPEQLMILSYLDDQNKGVIMQEISDILHRDNSAITRAIDTLLEKKYVEKSSIEGDRRKKMIFLTEEGKNVYLKAKAIAAVHVQEALEGLSKKNISEMFVYLNIIQENMIKLKEEL